MAYFLTADGGTESLRARVYDVAGTCLGSVAVPYQTAFSAGARAEQDPADWWANFVKASRGAIAEAGIDPTRIEAIAYATTCCSVVALDENGDALRPALIWMDVRAHAEADAVLATGDPALQLNGGGQGPVSAEWMIPKALWLKRNEPEIYHRAHRICEYQDFLTFKLTGEWAASLDNVGLRWHYRNDAGGWARSLVEALGIGDIVEKWPPRVVPPGEVIGTLSGPAAEALGLPRSVKVVQGGVDALIGMVGLGVSRPGQLALITGSSHLQFGVTGEPLSAPGVWGAYADILYPDRYIVEGGQTSTGSIINWLGRLTGGLDFAELNAKAAQLEPGVGGPDRPGPLPGQPHALHRPPVARGDPRPDSGAREASPVPGDHGGHRLRHAGDPRCPPPSPAPGYSSTEMTVGAAASASDLWLQIHADTSGLPIRIPASPDAPSTGSAVLAAVGAGRFGSIDESIAAMVRPGRTIEPDPANVARYEEIYQRYLAVYPAAKNILGR